MKLHHLRDVVAIAEHKSLRAAARHLGTVQPTLTRSLSELERELGAPLFERRSRGMLATPLGQAFVGRAVTILNDVRRAKDEFEQLRGNAVGSLAVGLSGSFAGGRLPSLSRHAISSMRALVEVRFDPAMK